MEKTVALARIKLGGLFLVLISIYLLAGCFQGRFVEVRIDGDDNQYVALADTQEASQDFKNKPATEFKIPLAGLLEARGVETSHPWQGFIDRMYASALSAADKEFWFGFLKQAEQPKKRTGAINISKGGTTTHNYYNGRQEAK